MEDFIKIRVSIADRVYPLRISPEREEGIRAAAKRIDEMIADYEQKYAVKDKQDILAMCALHFATNVEQKDISSEEDYTKALQLIKELNQELSSNF